MFLTLRDTLLRIRCLCRRRRGRRRSLPFSPKRRATWRIRRIRTSAGVGVLGGPGVTWRRNIALRCLCRRRRRRRRRRSLPLLRMRRARRIRTSAGGGGLGEVTWRSTVSTRCISSGCTIASCWITADPIRGWTTTQSVLLLDPQQRSRQLTRNSSFCLA